MKLCVLNDRISVDIETDNHKNEHALYRMKTLQIRLNYHIEGVNPALSKLSERWRKLFLNGSPYCMTVHNVIHTSYSEQLLCIFSSYPGENQLLVP